MPRLKSSTNLMTLYLISMTNKMPTDLISHFRDHCLLGTILKNHSFFIPSDDSNQKKVLGCICDVVGMYLGAFWCYQEL